MEENEIRVRYDEAEAARVNAEIAESREKKRKQRIIRRIIIGVIVILLAINYHTTFTVLTNAFRFITGTGRLYSEMCDRVYSGIQARETEIEIDPRIGSMGLQRLAHEFYGCHPELFYIERIEYSDFQKPYKLLITYMYTPEEVDSMTLEYNNIIDSIVSQTTDDMSDAEKVKFFHDYLAEACVYTNGFYDAYTMLTEHKGVCMSYALTMKALLDRCGITNEAVWSIDSIHAWNIVKLGGFWYHVDATWDDTGKEGNISYEYFLITDNEIRGKGHKHWHNGGAYSHSCFSPYYMLFRP